MDEAECIINYLTKQNNNDWTRKTSAI
jgi:hypothetical protein